MEEKNKFPDCKRFTGYKPCFPGHNCLEDGCKENIPVGIKILIINLDAMGDVLQPKSYINHVRWLFEISVFFFYFFSQALMMD